MLNQTSEILTAAGTVITAIGGATVGVLGTFLGYRQKFKKIKSKAENDHLQTFYDTMNDAMKAQEERHTNAIEQLRSEQREERKQWAEEKKGLYEKIDKLQDQARKDNQAFHSKDIQVTELKGKVELLQTQLDNYREHPIATIPKSVTVNT